jgi:DNA-binding IclR family transcriptional regulator
VWTDDGPVSLYKQEGEPRDVFELRTGLLAITTTAAGRLYVACLPAAATAALVRKEHSTQGEPMKPGELRTDLQQELHRRKYVTVRRAEGYTSIAAPVWDHHGEIRFALSLIGSRTVLQTERGSAHVKALLGSAERATLGLGGRPALGDG